MAESVHDDGSIADLPWGAVFDPVVNARALSAVQARGFRAAREVVDRFITMATDLDSPAREPESESEQARTCADSSAQGGIDIERALGTWQSMIGQLVNSVKDTVTPPAASGPAMFDLRTSDAAGQVVLNADGPGAVSTEVWLHNGGPEDMGKVRLRCGDLLAHDGAVIESDCVRFEPDVVAMPARSSRGIIVEVDVTDDHAPGSYRGTLLADGQPDVWLPVLLVVASELPDQ
ncbi:hypothetical protein [Mycobacterium sp. ACS4331]|uniref:hypothetical protein n=1 Tax=Mycobacterium sp. ACS4331 TaxID=1834121 RepID=UPI0007FBAFF3|nr:hypothetical protein [Mycobacterium sp. ACS4331]OBF16147.1 hypothetical protein A5727_14420 [Mycobacterium sp. ACS4331]